MYSLLKFQFHYQFTVGNQKETFYINSSNFENFGGVLTSRRPTPSGPEGSSGKRTVRVVRSPIYFLPPIKNSKKPVLNLASPSKEIFATFPGRKTVFAPDIEIKLDT